MRSRTSIRRPAMPAAASASILAIVAMALTPLAPATPVAGSSSLSAQDAADPDGEMPRTAWGHPDLQGDWSNATLTPFNRPAGQGPVLTPEEVERIERGQQELVESRIEESSDPDRPLPPGGEDPVCIDGSTTCYNEVYRDPGETVAVVDGEPRSSLVTRPADGRTPDLTPEGRARVAAHRARTAGFGDFDHPEVRPLAERCVISFGSSAGPPMLPNYWYNNNYTIVQNRDHVLIMTEMVHDARIIHLDGTPPPPADVRPWFGFSRGWWEGDTLVVETTNIHPDQTFRGVPPSDDLKIIERFTLSSPDKIVYDFTIDDPTTYTETWGGQVPFNRLAEGQHLYEYACHEANYSLYNVLSGARYEERQAAEGD